MSDTTDDMEAWSGFLGEDDEQDYVDELEMRVQKLEKIIYGLNIKINRLEKKLATKETE